MLRQAKTQLRERWAVSRKWAYENALLFFLLLGAVFVLLVIVVETIRHDAMGFSDKDFWDWMDLLIVPTVLALGAYFFSQSQKRAELALALDKQRHDTLQDYFDKMSELLLAGDLSYRLTGQLDPERHRSAELAASIAKARTFMVLRSLDGDRVRAVLDFFFYTQVDERQLQEIVYLSDGFLDGVDWKGVNLSKAVLEVASLVGANLQEATLYQTSLRGADLSEANLQGASLKEAYFERARLRHTDFRAALLVSANLEYTDLTGAIVSPQQLRQAASLEGATMPDGIRLRGSKNLEGPDFEEWYKRHPPTRIRWADNGAEL